jgi:rod shape-determining protein MreD
MRRCLVTFAALYVLYLLVAGANHSISSWHVYLFVGGLFVAISALTLPSRSGLATTLLAGLMFDANTPVPFGLHTLLFAAAHLLIFHIRDRVPREDTITRVVVALLANLALFLVFSFVATARFHEAGDVWPRLACDLLCSQVLLALIAPWCFALQSAALTLGRPGATDFEHGFE